MRGRPPAAERIRTREYKPTIDNEHLVRSTFIAMYKNVQVVHAFKKHKKTMLHTQKIAILIYGNSDSSPSPFVRLKHIRSLHLLPLLRSHCRAS